MRSELHIGDSAFTALAAEWDALLSRSATNTPFQMLAYQEIWWRHLQPANSTLFTVATRNNGGELAGIGSFFLLDGVLQFNGSKEESDYLDLISAASDAESVWRATLDCLESAEIPPWQSLDLYNIPQDSPSRAILPALAGERGYTFDESVAEVCPIISLPDSFDDYLESLDSKQRRELSRKLRRAEGSEVVTEIIDQKADLAADVDSFLDLLQKSTFDKRDWLNEGRRAVFHELAKAAQDGGYLQMMFTAVEERRAAALFNFDYNGRIWVYNSGLDPAAFAALSPGVVLTATAIRTAIELGRAEFDFLRGDEEYKYRFGAADATIYRHRLQRPTER